MQNATAMKMSDVDIDVRFIEAFTQATIHALKVQCNCEIQAEPSYCLTSSSNLSVDINSTIGLMAKDHVGTIGLCFKEPGFLLLLEKMFGEKFESVTDELAEAAGEILNIVFGTAKTQLNNTGFEVQMAIPTVVRGKDLHISPHSHGHSTLVVPFSGSQGLFQLLINLSKKLPQK